MRAYFGPDRRRIEHACRVAEFAERLLDDEKADRDVVLAAAVLHDIGIRVAEQKHGSSAGHYQEMEGPPIARQILARLGAEPRLVNEVCQIIASHHSPGEVLTKNFDVLWDADWLVNLPEEYDLTNPDTTVQRIDRLFRTEAGRRLARSLYVKAMEERRHA